MKAKITGIARILVGTLFIISGLIKANDTMGFAFKLEEYFASDVLNWPLFSPIAWELALIICIVEIVLGVALLAGRKVKLTLWSLLIMIVFFTFLTFYSAYFNKVTDCGCFGDAIKLTPWESFSKDVVLLILILILMWGEKTIEVGNKSQQLIRYGVSLVLLALFSMIQLKWAFPILFTGVVYLLMYLIEDRVQSASKAWIMAGVAAVISAAFAMHTYYHLPIRDYRPYAIDKSIREGMVPIKEDVREFVFVYKNNETGEELELTTEQLSGFDYSTHTYVDRIDKIIQEGIPAPVHDFVLETYMDKEDVTEAILSEPAIIIAIMYDLEKTRGEAQAELNELNQAASEAGIPMVGLSASIYEQVDEYRHMHQVMYPIYNGDGTMLKTIIRSNPGIIVLSNGTVKGKWHWFDMPNINDIKESLK